MSATGPGDDRPRRVELLQFRVGSEPYALEVGRVDSIARVPDVTRVPRTPPTVAGVARPRGETLVVVDAHELLGVGTAPPDGDDPLHRFLTVDRPEGGTGVGFVVDRVDSTRVVDVDRLTAPDDPGAATPPVIDPDHLLVVATTDDGPLPVLDAEGAVAAATAVAPDRRDAR
jgi:purine-binding chemotaxis protein CheW